jgi:FtsX-like permease family
VLITTNIVSAAVLAGHRRIGVLKSSGFTPAQVTLAYLAQIGAPALAGAAAGTGLGNRWALPFVNRGPFHLAIHAAPLWINITSPLGILTLVALAATVPALRAARSSAVEAIASGQAPRTGHGYAAHRLASRLALPRPVSIGLAAPLTRPARSAATLAAITFGLTAVVLAAGLDTSLTRIPGGQLVDFSLLHLLTAIIAVLAALGVQPSVYSAGELTLLALAGLGTAALGALVPAELGRRLQDDHRPSRRIAAPTIGVPAPPTHTARTDTQTQSSTSCIAPSDAPPFAASRASRPSAASHLLSGDRRGGRTRSCYTFGCKHRRQEEQSAAARRARPLTFGFAQMHEPFGSYPHIGFRGQHPPGAVSRLANNRSRPSLRQISALPSPRSLGTHRWSRTHSAIEGAGSDRALR